MHGGERGVQILETAKEEIKKLREEGIEPYAYKYDRDSYINEIHEKYKDIKVDELIEDYVSIAGRLMAIRRHGKASFAHISDISGTIQLYIKKNEVGDFSYNLFKRLNVGDIIGVKGYIFKTRTGELTILVKELTLLSKSIRPLPEKWHGLRDVETRYRKRYLDLIVNPRAREIFILRSKLIHYMRDFLDEHDFLEVETPILQPLYGGAMAKPFKTYHNALDMEMYLRIAPELYLKRLIVGGLEKVYEINKNFRNEGISIRHNPEFTMMELYEAYNDYIGMMKFTEEMIVAILERLGLGTKLTYQEHELDFSLPWKRITFIEAIEEYSGYKVSEMSDEEILSLPDKLDMEIVGGVTKYKVLKELFETYAEDNFIQPTFVMDYPTEISPLSKKKRGNPEFAERFELFIAGQEVGNAYSELNDPEDQLQRFLKQQEEKKKGDVEAHEIDYDYIEALEYGMPPTAGLGIGIDRLVMIVTDSPSIREVILFPHLRREKDKEDLSDKGE